MAGQLLGINPFDQPNVTESKENTSCILAEGLLDERPAAVIGAVEVRGSGGARRRRPLGARRREARPRGPGFSVPRRGYLAAMAYLDRERDAEAFALRAALARAPSTPSPSAGRRASCTRPASTTRADRRPASSCRSPARWTRICGARSAVHVRHPAGGAGRRRPEGARRPEPAPPAPAPHRPLRRHRAAAGGIGLSPPPGPDRTDLEDGP